MFERLIDIYNANRGDKPRITIKILAEELRDTGLTTSYEYGKKMIESVNLGNQIRINYKILIFTANLLGFTMDELFNQF